MILNWRSIANSLFQTKDRSPNVLVLYLERPATQGCAVACSLAGRFGYSDLKEAAPLKPMYFASV